MRVTAFMYISADIISIGVCILIMIRFIRLNNNYLFSVVGKLEFVENTYSEVIYD